MIRDTKLRAENNEEHILRPRPGDVWTEHMCLYHIVLASLPNGNVIIAERDLTIRNRQVVNLEGAKEITPEDHRKLVSYSNGIGFVADVMSNEASLREVDVWRKHLQERYLPLGVVETKPEPEKEEEEFILVSVKALRSLLFAVNGESYLIRELQATRNSTLFPDNPINVLTAQLEAYVTANNKPLL